MLSSPRLPVEVYMVVGRDQAANDQEDDNQNHKFHIAPLRLGDCRVAFPIAAAMSLVARGFRTQEPIKRGLHSLHSATRNRV